MMLINSVPQFEADSDSPPKRGGDGREGGRAGCRVGCVWICYIKGLGCLEIIKRLGYASRDPLTMYEPSILGIALRVVLLSQTT